MRKKESLATKPALKSTPAKSIGRGGARPGAGRKKSEDPLRQIHLDFPERLLKKMSDAGITNKTRYIISLVEADLKRNKAKSPAK
ncbi:hypothetical protein LZZ85_11435 [Terrimonas sp. NA20]|uniref:Uncharacterized protein n=1 Tax=Terrimonas ginsenosidimutans TaxID=2908004 RepID=A0ABS9KRF5_9BACT|nr:hypothetical protein [Terrimonas ginsenosidimutans]MCG2614901.1 hypothetical protein [Terrimonas ginsenosidimutans]